MCKVSKTQKALAFTAILLGLSGYGLPASAASGIYDNISTCTTTNCSALLINGTILQDALNDLASFTIPIFAAVGECIRVDLTSPSGTLNLDTKMVLVSPDGTSWTNDDRAYPSDRRPLIKVAGAPVRGWYTLQVSQYSGSIAPLTLLDISFYYGRYNAGNVNCTSPTSANIVPVS